MTMEEAGGGGILGRLGEKVLGWIALALVVCGAIAVWQMPGETKAAIWSAVWRTAVWFGLSAGWPWTAQLCIRRIAAAETNWAGVGLIAALTLGNVVLALLLMTGWPAGAWGWISALSALALAGTYNFLVTEYLAERAA